MVSPWLRSRLTLAKPATKSIGPAPEATTDSEVTVGLSLALAKAESVVSARVSAPIAKAQGLSLGLALAKPAAKSKGSASEADTTSIVAPGLGGHNGQEAELCKRVITQPYD